MASVKVKCIQPNGTVLNVAVKAKAVNVEALASMRIEAKRLFAESLAALVAVDVEAVE